MRIRLATLTDAVELAPNMREADKEEVLAGADVTPLEALKRGLVSTTNCMALVNDQNYPLGMFGVAPDLHFFDETGMRCGWIWFLGAPEATHKRLEFMRLSKAWIKRTAKHYDILMNYVDARNVVHIKWLKAMGFNFVDVHLDFGPHKRMFLEFSMVCREEKE